MNPPSSTAERARLLAQACRDFEPLLVPCSASAFLEWVRLELGHEEILDSFQRHGPQYSRAIAPAVCLHIVSGNTPHAALQSLVRGLLLGSHNLCKLPGGGLPEAEAFVQGLPPPLRPRVELATRLPESWLSQADAIVVFGSDETIEHFRRQAAPHQIFSAHGHRISLGLVFSDPEFASVDAAARDASLFDQQGCLSPHCFYVKDEPAGYAAALARGMERRQAIDPRGALSLPEAAAIAELRETFRFRAANGAPVRLWESEGSSAWTVIFDADPCFAPSCLNRVVFVRPLPDDPSPALAAMRGSIGTIGVWPNTRAAAEAAAALGASRVCALGSMQMPLWTWRQDGAQSLAGLVRWIDWQA